VNGHSNGDRSDDEPRPHRRPGPDLEHREVIRGSRSGNQHVRITRAVGGGLRRTGAGRLETTEQSLRPRSPFGRVLNNVKRVLIGQPLATAELANERLTKVKALAVFSSDALSSSAYATEQIIVVLVAGGAAALSYTLPIAIAITVLLAIVATSYRQTIKAYPQGGGSYIVTKDNLGTYPSLIAGSALLIDYVLTVAVSVSAGVAAVTSAIQSLHPFAVELGVAFILLIMLVNLRGVRESGSIFAAPTYAFLLMAFLMIGLGAFHLITEGPGDLQAKAASLPVVEPLSIFLILRAFASGNAALTGTEAISDGVPAFKPPEWQNARTTLTWMACILGFLFLGITYLAVQFAILPSSTETVISQLGRIAYGDSTVPYFAFQAATTLILVLAANTSFSDFPRLSYFLARDHFLPHQFGYRGDRLAFSTGIFALSIPSIALMIAFRAETDALIPLYAVGVFVSFTASQASMVVRWWRRREPGWQRGLPINALGAVTTCLVAIIIAATKFEHGAWMVIVLIPILVMTMRAINHHYVKVADLLALDNLDEPVPNIAEPYVIIPVPGINRATQRTLAIALKLSHNVTAIHVTDDREAGDRLRERWEALVDDVPLVVLESPFRALVGAVQTYLDALQQREPDRTVIVVLSEFVPHYPWEYVLHNQTALALKGVLFLRPNTVVMDVPYHLVR
jgi:amino acid transporter